MGYKLKDLDSSTLLRAFVMLKEILENPELHTVASLADLNGVSRDTVRRYMHAMKMAGFNVEHNSYPDYQYYISSIDSLNDKDMKIDKSFLTKYNSTRHQKAQYITVNRVGRLIFSPLFATVAELSKHKSLDIEQLDDHLVFEFKAKGTFELKLTTDYIPRYYFASKDFITYVYDFFKVAMGPKASFRLSIQKISESKYKVSLSS